MAKFGTCAAVLLTVVGVSSAVNAWGADVWAADVMPMTTPPATAAAPKPCTDPSDFIYTNCQLTWRGITIYVIVDMGLGWQSHGAPFDPQSAVAASYLIQKQNRSGGPEYEDLAGKCVSASGPVQTRGCRASY
jgi:hypothetical protein